MKVAIALVLPLVLLGSAIAFASTPIRMALTVVPHRANRNNMLTHVRYVMNGHHKH
jgi:hypothetical protein